MSRGEWRKVTAFQNYAGEPYLVFTYDAWFNEGESVVYFVSDWHRELIQADITAKWRNDIFEVGGEVVIATVDPATFSDAEFYELRRKLLETSLLRFLYEMALRDPELNYGLEALLDEKP
ncbi:hypothetical protein JOC54_001597 [Alkalihalobacillus xiaoxiensis]|uniref:DUF4268 domain-containing protein n=1 Tax=Shouchella xiaoxiensis TaxID=766895 RepID=A0ABS2SS66_9BACI|nr:hypothetical protein [Shouchella xiaoxiensis]MBM7838341.1 hypothetical protein [Shouchella xiaoxiensis]